MSVFDMLVQRRCAVTGESHHQALKALEPSRDSFVRARWKREATTGLLLPDHECLAAVRLAVLPAATVGAQAELEAALLRAMSEAVHHLHRRLPFDLTRQAKVIEAVEPRTDGLRIHISPAALGPLITELLPTAYQEPDMDPMTGFPGLRYKVGRRRVTLGLVDCPTASIELVGVSRRQWRAAMVYRNLYMRSVTWSCIGERYADTMSPEEVDKVARYARVWGPAVLASAVLRRIGLLQDVLWIQVWNSGPSCLNVEWPGDSPRKIDVAAQLLDPVIGMGDGAMTSATQIDFGRTVTMGPTQEPGGHSLRLRWTSLPEEDSALADSEFGRTPRPEWVAWHSISHDLEC